MIEDRRTVEDLADRVEAWGYPRELSDYELDYGAWVIYGDWLIVWYTPGRELGEWVMHICTDPGQRGLHRAREVLYGFDVVPQLWLRAYRLWVPSVAPGIAAQLQRMGWRVDRAVGWVKVLGTTERREVWPSRPSAAP